MTAYLSVCDSERTLAILISQVKTSISLITLPLFLKQYFYFWFMEFQCFPCNICSLSISIFPVLFKIPYSQSVLAICIEPYSVMAIVHYSMHLPNPVPRVGLLFLQVSYSCSLPLNIWLTLLVHCQAVTEHFLYKIYLELRVINNAKNGVEIQADIYFLDVVFL